MFIVLLFIVGAAANQCDLVEPELQYWVNTATTARGIALQGARSHLNLRSLEVTGDATFGDVSVKSLRFDRMEQTSDSANNIFRGPVAFNKGIQVSGTTVFTSAFTGAQSTNAVSFTNLDIEFGAYNTNLSTLISRIETLEQKLQQNCTCTQ